MLKHRTAATFTLLALTGAALAQGPKDILYYKFDEGGGRKAVNYASGSGIAPAEGNVIGTYVPTHAPGILGTTSLIGGTGTTAATSNYVDSGYQLSMSNSDFTMAFYIKQRTAPPSTNYFFYSNSSFRLFTGGVAGKGLYLRVWGGTPADLILATDIQALAATAWTHIAIVVDATALTATYYVNGVAQTPITITTGVTATGGTYTVHVGNTAAGQQYDLDEFRLSARAASAAEVMSWLTKTTPADGAYGKGCNGGTLGSSGGAPKLGNAAYALTVGGSVGNLFAVALGSSRTMAGAVPLPLDLGLIFAGMSGCNWESSAEISIPGVLASATVNVPLPIPPILALDGAPLWCQALAFSPAASIQSTNGLAIGLGQ